MKGRFEHHRWYVKIAEWLGLMLLCTLLAMLLWGVCTPQPASLNALRVLQVLQDVATFILPCVVCWWLWGWSFAHEEHEETQKSPKSYVLCPKSYVLYPMSCVLLVILAAPFINLLLWTNQQMQLPECLAGLEAWMQAQEANAAALTERFLQADNVWQMLMNVCIMALLPAFAEELTFRGTLQRLLTKGNHHIAIWVAAIVFSAIHLQFYGFLPRMLMGAAFGYLYVWSGTLWLPILAHFTNNAMAVITYYIAQKTSVEPEWFDTIGTGSTLWLGVLSAIIVAAGLYFLRQHYSTRDK